MPPDIEVFPIFVTPKIFAKSGSITYTKKTNKESARYLMMVLTRVITKDPLR